MVACFQASTTILNGMFGSHEDLTNYGRPFNPVKHWHRQRVRNRFKDKSMIPREAPHYQPITPRTNEESNKLFASLSLFECYLADNPLGITSDEVMLLFDCGASCTIVHDLDDFIGDILPVRNCKINGIADGLEVKGMGTVQYKLKDTKGKTFILRIENALYVPRCPARLICPQQVAAQAETIDGITSGLKIEGEHATLTHNGHTVIIPYDESNNLPMLATEPGVTRYANFICRECNVNEPIPMAFHAANSTSKDSTGKRVTWADNVGKGVLEGGTKDHLTKGQRELLKWHNKLGHRGFDHLQDLARQGVLPKQIANVEHPMCPACKFGAQTKRPAGGGKLDDGHDEPGSKVSGDILEAGVGGLIPTTRGRRSKRRNYAATIFVDHYSRLAHAHMQESTSAADVCEAKMEFETWASRYNVSIDGYHTDNHPFSSKEFREQIRAEQQDLTQCAVGAHHQNGIVERKIRTITTWARTMLLHAMYRWPQIITEEFWTFAVAQAVKIHNAMPLKGRGDKAPWEMFTDEECPWSPGDFQVFGCPVYVLAKELQDGNDVKKWKERARLGVYVGHSSNHAGNVVLVYNPETGHVSPQYHVVFDSGFTTVSPSTNDTKKNFDEKFKQLFTSDRWDTAHFEDYDENPYHFQLDGAWDDEDEAELEINAPAPAVKRLRASADDGKTTSKVSSQPQDERVSQPAAAKAQGDATCASNVRQREADGEQNSLYALENGDKVIEARPVYKEAEDAPNTKGTQTVGTDCIVLGGPAADMKAQLAELIRKHFSEQDVENNAKELASTYEGVKPTERSQHQDDSVSQPIVDDGHQQPDPGQTRGLPPKDDADTAKSVNTTKRRESNKRQRSTRAKAKKLISYPKGPHERPYNTRSSKDVNLSELKGLVAGFYKEIGEEAPGDATDDSAADRTAKCDESPPESTPIDAFIATMLAKKMTVDDGSDEGIFNVDNPVVFNSMLQAMNNKEDILTQGQMLALEDPEEKRKFREAQASEMSGLEELDAFEYVRTKDLPKGTKMLRSVWSYRRKRNAFGLIYKHKARICADGSRQEKGIDYVENYAPVVGWSTVRLALTIAAILDLNMRQMDFTQAFPQAETSEDTYMHIPAGWTVEDDKGNTDYCIKLKRNLYGTATGARNWFKKLSAGLLARGFYQSKIDPCLFLRNNCMVVVYTDDCIVFSEKESTATELMADLKSDGFLLKDEGDAKDFLGVQIEKKTVNGKTTITMTQPAIIESILEDLGLTDTPKVKSTPAQEILHADPEGAGRKEYQQWNYRSVIGKLNYLAMNTRPDISFAVHQCAKYCNNPKMIHEKAVKYIGRYLAGTKDHDGVGRGIILTPEANGKLDAYVDSDFAGRWHQDYAQLRDSVLSRTGYVITYCNCPVTWSSKLQTEITLSTTEAEYVALSTMMRTLLPMRTMLKEIIKHTVINLQLAETNAQMTSMHTSEVHEDNAGCIVLANSDEYRPRTKHLAIKWHHFKDQVRNGFVKVTKIDTKDNWADIFTKATDKQTFLHLRKLMMGW